MLHNVYISGCEPTQETAGSGLNRLYYVLCLLWNIHLGAPLPRIYSITNAKHWITYTCTFSCVKAIITCDPKLNNTWPELMFAVSLILKRIMLSLPLASADIISRRFVNWPFVCLIWFFTSHQQSFSYTGTGLPGLN